MEELKKRLKQSGFVISFDPRGDGNRFFSAAAYQLDLEAESLKNVIFRYLEKHPFDVSTLFLLLFSTILSRDRTKTWLKDLIYGRWFFLYNVNWCVVYSGYFLTF